jgi:hypothetical protein
LDLRKGISIKIKFCARDVLFGIGGERFSIYRFIDLRSKGGAARNYRSSQKI